MLHHGQLPEKLWYDNRSAAKFPLQFFDLGTWSERPGFPVALLTTPRLKRSLQHPAVIWALVTSLLCRYSSLPEGWQKSSYKPESLFNYLCLMIKVRADAVSTEQPCMRQKRWTNAAAKTGSGRTQLPLGALGPPLDPEEVGKPRSYVAFDARKGCCSAGERKGLKSYTAMVQKLNKLPTSWQTWFNLRETLVPGNYISLVLFQGLPLPLGKISFFLMSLL